MKPLDKIQKVLDDIVRKKDVFLKLGSLATNAKTVAADAPQSVDVKWTPDMGPAVKV